MIQKSVKPTLFLLGILLLTASACGETEMEQAQQREYEMQLQQQMIEISESFRSDLEDLLDRYFHVKDALVASDTEQAAFHTGELAGAGGQLDAGDLNPETAAVWEMYAENIVDSANRMAGQTDLDEQRIVFEDLSETMIRVVDTFRPAGYGIFVQSCPMVRGGSAEWLSREEEIRNPYHGDRMMNCGEVLRRI